MTDIIKFLDNNRKVAVYIGGNTSGLYLYIEMVRSPTTLTTSDQHSCYIYTSSSTNNDTASLQPVIAYLRMIQKIICKLCGRIGHRDDACIIHGPKLFPPIIIIKMNQFNALHGDEPTEPPI